jgi:hypothetical protein
MASTDPVQVPPKITSVSPFAPDDPNVAALRDRVFSGPDGERFEFQPAGLQPAQRTGMAATGGFLGDATPYYGTGVDTLNRTAAGGYLDPSRTSAYRNLEARTRALATSLFGDLSRSIAGRSAGQGAFFSSARQNQQQEQARRLTGQVEQDLASRLFGQYGAERGYQQQAAGIGAQLAPGLAAQLFGQGTTTRAQTNQESELALRSFLANQGLSQLEIANMMGFIGLTQPKLFEPLVGPSEDAQKIDKIKAGTDIAGTAIKGGQLAWDIYKNWPAGTDAAAAVI